jgi:hypothetical protein
VPAAEGANVLRTLYAHKHNAPPQTQLALAPGSVMRARTESGFDKRDIGDIMVIVAIVPVKPGEVSFLLTTFDKHGMHGPREVAGDWFTWDNTYELLT